MKLDISKSVFIDHHAHSILKRHLDADVVGFRRAFSESNSLSMIENHVPHSLHYMNMRERLKDYLRFETDEELVEARQALSASDYVNELWDDASIGGLLIDDGFNSEASMSVNELAKVCGRPVFKIVRLESVFERVICERDSFQDLINHLQLEMNSFKESIPVGFKTIAAYRGGLPREPDVDLQAAKESFSETRRQIEAASKNDKKDFRISASPLYHYLLLNAFQLAAHSKLPIQIHTGIGDADLVLHEANPTVMTPILKDKRFASCKFVFLHCYPYHREAAYLCSVFPNCYMDLSLSVILVSAMSKGFVRESLAIAPATKILAGSDGHTLPEMHWYGAVVMKEALQAVLNDLIDENYLTLAQAQSIAENVLYRNCRELYQLEGLL